MFSIRAKTVIELIQICLNITSIFLRLLTSALNYDNAYWDINAPILTIHIKYKFYRRIDTI